MNLRELMIQRILYACDDQTLIRDYGMLEDEMYNLSDVDLFEMYEDVMGLTT